MKENLIQTITDAESEVSEVKRQAAAQAETYIAQAEEKARSIGKTSAEACKGYTETQLRLATVKGEKYYAEQIAAAEAEAAAAVESAGKNAEIAVSGIVGRIVFGKEDRQ